MGSLRDLEIVWDDLLEAFENDDDGVFYFLDRSAGEVFAVPEDYEDEDFWQEISVQPERFLQIPAIDHSQQRFIFHEFIKDIDNNGLKLLLIKSFTGKNSFGKLDDILSFYPEEEERLLHLRQAMVVSRIRQWLEENDIYLSESSL